MSMLPSSSEYLGSTSTTDINPVHETFHKFFECWLVEQDQYLQELISACKDHNNNNDDKKEANLRPLINRVLNHYEYYYRAKSRWAKHNVLAMLTPSWRSDLEDAFLWIGGWRPSMAFQLLYSKSGLQLEAQLHDLIRGLGQGDLGDLSPTQLTRADEMQRTTIREERELTEKLASVQETVADGSMTELSHEVSEMIRSMDYYEGQEARVESTLAPKEEELEEVLQKANDLRLTTLKAVIEILTPIQAVHFLIAAAELHLRLHDWGKKKDAREHRGRHN